MCAGSGNSLGPNKRGRTNVAEQTGPTKVNQRIDLQHVTNKDQAKVRKDGPINPIWDVP
jgi:hypothetical protein